ncbi:FAD-binding domain-containing protein [Hypoxylon sp. NC1633]|nr:FAD-binding domain-containing protein [Hypoxylon sp. NC1633]
MVSFLNGSVESYGDLPANLLSLAGLNYSLEQVTMTWPWLFLGASLLTRLDGAEATPPLVQRTWNGATYGCKCYLGDDCWPDDSSWAELNSTVNGNLVVNIPPAASCYNSFEGPLGTIPTYDAAACAEATANWANETWGIVKPAAALWTFFTNDTCRLTDDPSATCTLGFYGIYVILAQTRDHIKAGLDFARQNNLRVIIRNTGHDFIGRSTGWGALIINTHGFQDIEFTTKYDGPGNYDGGAVTIGAGVQALTLLTQANAQVPPVAVITGECATVGVAGGLVQGGGHGPLTPSHGFLADSALSFDVLTADGKYLTANRKENPDLFWALKGGGPSTFAIVLSLTIKTFPEQEAAGVSININSTLTNDTGVFWDGVKTFHKYTNRFARAGLYAYFEIMPMRLHIQPIVGVGKTSAEMDVILEPMFDEFEAKGISYDTESKAFDTLFDLYIDLFEPEPAGTTSLTGGWMFTHEDVAEHSDDIVDAFKTVISPRDDLESQGFIIGHLWDAGLNMPVSNSATNPRFRKSTDIAIAGLNVPENATWAQKQDLQDVVTNIQDAAMRNAAPHGCAYVNEVCLLST